MNGKEWITKITGQHEGEPIVRGFKLTELIEKLNFTQTIFLVLKGDLPNEKEEKMLNAILVSCVDHGVEAPSTTTARIVASCGTPLSTAVAAGVSAIGDSHGGAIEEAARIFQEAVEKERSAKEIVEKVRFKGDRIPGYGHRIYDVDPRTQALLKAAKDLNLYGKHVEIAIEIEKELQATTGKKLPLNIDGAIAAIVSEMGFDWRLGKGFFIIGRIAGLVAHVYEEQTEGNVMRRIKEEDVEYKGPDLRKL